jgi:hypothetical protein
MSAEAANAATSRFGKLHSTMLMGSFRHSPFCCYQSVQYPKYKSNSEYDAMFDVASHVGCDYISNTLVVQGMEGLDAFSAIKRRPTHTQAAGWEDHNA